MKKFLKNYLSRPNILLMWLTNLVFAPLLVVLGSLRNPSDLPARILMFSVLQLLLIILSVLMAREDYKEYKKGTTENGKLS